jgi:hypothetical protein
MTFRFPKRNSDTSPPTLEFDCHTFVGVAESPEDMLEQVAIEQLRQDGFTARDRTHHYITLGQRMEGLKGNLMSAVEWEPTMMERVILRPGLFSPNDIY